MYTVVPGASVGAGVGVVVVVAFAGTMLMVTADVIDIVWGFTGRVVGELVDTVIGETVVLAIGRKHLVSGYILRYNQERS
jgi:hypothetical protein